MPACAQHGTASESEGPSEFLVSAHGLLPYFLRFLEGDSELIVGCGNSALSELLSEARSIPVRISMDNDQSIIQQMREKCPALQWEVADATAMPYADCAFDSVVDKSLLDFLIYTARDEHAISKMLLECHRVTRPEGRCIFLSWCPPREMAVHMAGCEWQLQIVKLEAPCTDTGQVPVDATIVEVPIGEFGAKSGLDVRTEQYEHRTNFYIYVCSVSAAQPVEKSADDLAEEGDFQAAIQAFTNMLTLSPCDAKLYESIAQCHMMLDNEDQVRKCLVYALKATLLDEQWADGQLTLARCHLCNCNFNLAVQAFHKVLQLDPSMTEQVEEDLAIANAKAMEGKRRAGIEGWLENKHNDMPLTCPPCSAPL